MTECYDWYISSDPYVAPTKTYKDTLQEVLIHGQRVAYSTIYNELMIYRRQQNVDKHMPIDKLLETKDVLIRAMVREYIHKRKLNNIPNSWFKVFDDIHHHFGLNSQQSYIFSNNNLDIIVQQMAKSLAAAYQMDNDPEINPVLSKAFYDRRWAAFAKGLSKPILANYKPAGIIQILQWYINNPYLKNDQLSKYEELRNKCEGLTMRAIRREINNAK